MSPMSSARCLAIVVLSIVLFGCHCSKKTETAMSPDKTPTSSPSTTKPTGSMVFGLGPGFELAPRAVYSATQKGGEVIIIAKGENPTPGFEMKLVQSPLRIWPPQWMLARKRPDGIVAQVITPFEVTGSFKSDDPINAVRISDAAGRHEIPVEQASK